MKATKLTLHLVVGLLCAGLSGGAIAGVIFSEDFSGDPSKWNNERGSWRILDGTYDAVSPSNNPTTYTQANTALLTDFTVEVNVLVWHDGGVCLRSSYAGGQASGVMLITGGGVGSGDGLYWHVVQNDVGLNGWQVYENTPDLGLRGGNHRLKVEVQGNTYQAFVDGVLKSTLVDSTFSSGYFGLYDFSSSFGTDARGQRFDNVAISTAGNGTPTVPEPATLALLGLGLAGIGFSRRRQS